MNVRTKEEIEIDFSRAICKAEQLEDIAVQLSKMANNQVVEAVDALRGSYKGDNATLLIDKGIFISGEIFEAADDLIKVANNIRSTADLVYKAEKSAICLV